MNTGPSGIPRRRRLRPEPDRKKRAKWNNRSAPVPFLVMLPLRFMRPLGSPRPDPRQRALAEWRGQDLAPLEAVRERLPRPAGVVLTKVLADLRIDRRRAEAEIVRAWNHLIDPVLAAHAQPTGLHKGTLFVTIDSPVWRDEIVRYRRREILDRLQHAFGREMIARISFRLG
jgi:hypothetical protein